MPETQRCAACKRPLSRYNPDPLCSSCLRAARHGPDGAETTGHEAMGVLNLGKPSRSETLYRTVLDGNLTRRNRTYYGALLSGALLKQDAREHAIAEGMSILPALADGVTSVRTLNELRPLRAVDGPQTEERAAFCEQFDAVARSMAS